MVAVVGISILSGIALGYLGMPAFVQPLHLVGASVLFGQQFLIWISHRHAREALQANPAPTLL